MAISRRHSIVSSARPSSVIAAAPWPARLDANYVGSKEKGG
jgi:hypothetical protein